ncbi:S8 family peptidase [Psychromicrobium xiongbiense]|uniref:S8 family peptidase n=1 Tax=Psychromicrobium xiongbiense TaxID=3051184 RepID=UPI0025553AC2|nr:S8 family serine peptidase [Psychromicrobium sp. YIM S02556]
MTPASNRFVRTAVVAGLTGIALLCSAAVPASAAPPSPPQPGVTAGIDTNASTAPANKIHGNLADAQGKVSVYVQLSGQGAYEATQPQSVKNKQAAPVDASGAVQQIRSSIQQKADSVAQAASASTIYTTTNTLPGVAITGDATAIRALATRSDVVKITPIVSKSIPDNKNTDIDTRALNTWTRTGQTGKGIKIAVIDTGVDYTHTDFGGPGTQDAYTKAAASSTLVPGTYDPNKFLGGYDLAGDSYDANPNDSTYNPVPTPDANPLDCRAAGHGSHVAGTAAGYGVNEDGSTFTSGKNGNPPYSELTPGTVSGMRIGPGSAPEAQIMAFRVFGCYGSTDLVIQALDRALDPNQDGKFDDRADIINMSLGADWATTDDPENDVINELTKNGILSVVASGNAGDSYDIGGSPGNAKTSLTVANSVGSKVALDRVDVLAPTAGQAAGQYSGFDAANFTADQLKGTVVMGPAGTNVEGCQPFSAADAARVKDKWVWLHWTDDSTRPCGSAVRFNNAQAAGAKGVVLDSGLDVFAAGIAGNATIPGVQLTKTYSDQLRPAAQAGTLIVALNGSYRGTASGVSNKLDTLNSSSSRGVHGSNGIVKPDVAAPGTLIGSVGVGTGNGASVKSGTSMATPHVAGIAALVMAQTKLPALAVKAIVMNTAVHDIYSGQFVYGPNRVGSGRVDALDGTTTKAYAYATDDPELTSLSFGVVEVGDQPVSISKTVTVASFDSAARSYAATYLPATTIPGVNYLISPAVNVPTGGSATITVTLSIPDPKALRKTMDPTLEKVQLNSPRQFLADASGRLELSSQGAPSLRVPVYTAPKPTSAMTAGPALTFANTTATSTPVTLSGRQLSQGAPGADGYNGLVAPFVLQTSSPRIATLDPSAAKGAKENSSIRAMDLQNVGVSSTVPALKAAGLDPQKGDIAFGISTWGNWPALSNFYRIYINIDTNNDGKPDYRLGLAQATGLDLPLVQLLKINPDGSGTPVSTRPLNGVSPVLDTNMMDTNVLVMPVSLSALGLDASKPAPFSYTVTTYSNYLAKDGQLTPVDSTTAQTFDPVNPALWFDNGQPGTLFFDRADNALTAHRAADAPAGTKVLFLHLQNATGDLGAQGDGGKKAEVVPLSFASGKVHGIPAFGFQGFYGAVQGKSFTPGTTVSVMLDGVPVKNLFPAKVNPGGVVFAVFQIPAGTTPGEHTVTLTDESRITGSTSFTVLKCGW